MIGRLCSAEVSGRVRIWAGVRIAPAFFGMFNFGEVCDWPVAPDAFFIETVFLLEHLGMQLICWRSYGNGYSGHAAQVKSTRIRVRMRTAGKRLARRSNFFVGLADFLEAAPWGASPMCWDLIFFEPFFALPRG